MAATTESLLAAICADPADVESRQVYGDLLTESGDPRGEFIALHCRLDEMSGLEEEYPAMLARAERLEAEHGRKWMGEYAERVGIDPRGYTRFDVDEQLNAVFRGGFLYRIVARLEDVSAQWGWLREREPVQGLELLVGESIPEEFRQLSEPAAFRTLKVTPSDWFTGFSLGYVLHWGLAEIRELDLSGCDLGVGGCQLLIGDDSGYVGDDGWTTPSPLPESQLLSLRLRGCKIRDEGARALLASRLLSAAEVIDFGQCHIAEGETLEALRRIDAPNLAQLRLDGNDDLGGRLDPLFGWAGLARLRHLAVPKSATAADLAGLFTSPSPSLRELDLSSAKELVKEVQQVAAAAEALTLLDIGTTRIGDKGFSSLLASDSLANLRDLHAGGCSLSDKGLAALCSSDIRLVHLDLSSNKLTDAGLAVLAGWPNLATITSLRIGNNRKVSPTGYQALIDSPHFEPTRLDIGKCTDGDVLGPLRERFGDAAYARAR